jgi:uncharacterized protein
MIRLLIRHKSSSVFFAALACLLLASVSLRAQTTQSPVPMPNPPTPVVDTANVIDDATEKKLNALLKNLSENKQADVEMGVVTVKTTGGRDIFEYSLAIMRGWGIGNETTGKGGLLLLVAVDDRKYFTQVSRHLEGDLTDATVGSIQRERLVPAFRQGQYSQGIYDTAMAYIATLSEKRGFSIEGMDQRYAYRPRTTSAPAKGGGISACGVLLIILLVLIILMMNRGGGGGGGCLNMLLLGSLLNSGRGWGGGSGWSSGGWGSGGSSWGGGGGSDWGGFSGGGGDAGGGGAGGGW